MMIRVSFKKRHKNGGTRSRFVGLLAAAEQLEVTREHLYQVLSGRRISVSLRSKVSLTPIAGKPGHKKVEVL